MTKLSIIGSGLLATQIAAQAVNHGFDVTVYNHRNNFESFDKYCRWVTGEYAKFFEGFDVAEFDVRLGAVNRTGDLDAAVQGADIVIESAVEDLAVKQELFKQVEKAAPAGSLFFTNSSTLLPTEISALMTDPSRLTAMHFGNMIWKMNIVEIMGSENTSGGLLQKGEVIARDLGMVPVVIKNPLRGYLLNSMLIPFIDSGLRLLTGGYANPEDIDNVWRISTSSSYGPFQAIDIVGFKVVTHTLMANPDEKLRALGAKFASEIEQGRSGMSDGVGFYLYDANGDIVGPNPAWHLDGTQ
ncbi:3-hydroxyacyl-CoA dehydrogenase NAD-binding domain-containing protein [Corynebacterium sp. UBA2622]|uniref:3-hydroxyacyl-CoA dehydrogenase NAD-binding domain-containing protein n=1 Tax=Corynebacterium sp. UBA2622 TaxID=1946393 RepID=UPI0025B7CC6E|nr:3-hydroxyacyl-CoA dehydrogenase NAD-binding domain-containing protein [Corynebacterium sp. UBA2622]